LADHPNARALADMIAAGSPYLFDLIVGSPARWLDLLRADPQTRLAAIVADIADAANADQETAMRRWRQARAQAALLIAMADIGGVWDVVDVTAALTQVADAAVGAAVRPADVC
jgi:glutamate-ammonia-ligase adenylyltransferase